MLKQIKMNGRHLSYMLKHLQIMPDDLEAYYETTDSVADYVDLDSYVPSQPKSVSSMFITIVSPLS